MFEDVDPESSAVPGSPAVPESSAVPGSPGADAAAWLGEFAPAGASAAGLIDALGVVQRQAAWLAATQARVLAELQITVEADLASAEAYQRGTARQRAEVVKVEQESLSVEVGLVLRIPTCYAQERMVAASTLVRRLPDTLALLAGGQITAVQASVLVEAVIDLDPQASAAVQAKVLERAPHQTTTQFRRAVKRAVLTECPKDAEQVHADGLAERHVSTRAGEFGLGILRATLAATDVLRVDAAITDHARRYLQLEPTDPRTLDQRRADAFVDLIELGAAAAAADPRVTPTKSAPLIQVVVSLATLTGDSDEPAELIGHGPIPASMARLIASDPTGTWRRLITDTVSQVIGYGRRRYKPPSNLDTFIRIRDRYCTFPGCNRRADKTDRAEVDHIQPWADLGETNPENLTALCVGHHHLKHRNGWVNTRDPTTAMTTWHSPTHHTYTKHPPELPGTIAS